MKHMAKPMAKWGGIGIFFLALGLGQPTPLHAGCFSLIGCLDPGQPSFTLTESADGEAIDYTLNWDPIAPSTPSAIVTYYLFESTGLDIVPDYSSFANSFFNTTQ